MFEQITNAYQGVHDYFYADGVKGFCKAEPSLSELSQKAASEQFNKTHCQIPGKTMTVFSHPTCPAPTTKGYLARAYNALKGAASYVAPYALPVAGATVAALALGVAAKVSYNYVVSAREAAAQAEAKQVAIDTYGLSNLSKAAELANGWVSASSRAHFAASAVAGAAKSVANAVLAFLTTVTLVPLVFAKGRTAAANFAKQALVQAAKSGTGAVGIFSTSAGINLTNRLISSVTA